MFDGMEKVAAGSLDDGADGSVQAGAGFTVTRLSKGEVTAMVCPLLRLSACL